MTGDVVRAALEAAGEVARRTLTKPPCCMEGTGCELPPCHCAQVAAAAAIVAFLPKAQASYAAHYGSPSPQIGWLIAAVEVAAEKQG
jgi:hypothetical protein